MSNSVRIVARRQWRRIHPPIFNQRQREHHALVRGLPKPADRVTFREFIDGVRK